MKEHEGNVWTIIYSLRREDAARLGYDNAASWRALLRSKQADFAEAMQIQMCIRDRDNTVKYDVKALRRIKSQLYELVKTNKPTQN